jgi:Asp-tRNA(Asn)/Glu-tRNA(Gln) amidotransferase A subunit family amidase
MIRSLVDNSFSILEKELQSIKTYKELKKFYARFFRKFNKLNSKYKFSTAADIRYIDKQLKNIDFKKKNIFFGIPFGIKDIFNTKFLKTEFGSILFKNFLPGNNARIVDIIEEKQGIVFCKTTTAEFAVHYFPERKTLNPYSSKHITGTSSAGSAVSVSCGALPVSLGTQTAGSIIRPASFCGVIGFKPSFGALDRTGILKTADTLDNVGLFSLDIYGIKKVFKNLIQHSNQYPYSKNFFLKKKNKKIKIALISNSFKHYKNYDDIVKKDFDYFCERYLKSYDYEIDLKIKFIEGIHQHHDRIYCKSLAYYFSSLQRRKMKMSKIMLDMIEKGNKISKKNYLRAISIQQNLTKKFEKLMENYDFLITPSTATVAPLIGKNEKKDTSLIWSFFGAPSISLPIFYDKITGLPFGLQIISSRYNDFQLLNFSEKIIKNLKKY